MPARLVDATRILFVSDLQADERGILSTCPNCGKRNRLKYEGLGGVFRCGQCRRELPSLGEPVDLTSDLVFDSLIAHSAIPVLVDFWAPWCGPCKMVAPEIRKVAAELAGKYLIVKVNTEEVPSLARRYRITAIPTMMLFDKGFEVARQPGAMPAPGIRQFINQSQSTQSRR
jgi:thioredoxin 2